jgi:hypothetical protein
MNLDTVANFRQLAMSPARNLGAGTVRLHMHLSPYSGQKVIKRKALLSSMVVTSSLHTDEMTEIDKDFILIYVSLNT